MSPRSKPIVQRRRYADTADVCEAIVGRLLTLGFPIDTESTNCIDVLDALDQVGFWKNDVLKLDVLTVNCAEAELQGAMQHRDIHVADDDPLAQTIRDLHRLLQRLDPNHQCSVDDDLPQVKTNEPKVIRPRRKRMQK